MHFVENLADGTFVGEKCKPKPNSSEPLLLVCKLLQCNIHDESAMK
jgi:hypothetical protein